MMATRTRRSSVRRSGAILTMELLFIFPILMAIFFGTVEYGLLLAAEARLTNASREGARVAAAGGDFTDVVAACKLALPASEQSLVFVSAILKSASAGNPPVSTGDPVTVMVSSPANVLVPDYLRFIGISICHKCLIGQTVMRKE